MRDGGPSIVCFRPEERKINQEILRYRSEMLRESRPLSLDLFMK